MFKYAIALLACGSMSAATLGKKPAKRTPDIVASISQSSDLTRSLAYSEREIPTLTTRIGYMTVILLPAEEKILDILWGDKQGFAVNGADGTNFAHITPKTTGARTNLNLITASGNVYSFLLQEGGTPDLKVIVQPKDPAMVLASKAAPRWVTVAELDNVRGQLESEKALNETVKAEAERATREAHEQAVQDLAKFRSAFPSSLKHDYDWKDNSKTRRVFGVEGIAHNQGFTYIWADPPETPVLFETKDGKPSVINFQYENGVYIVPKVVDSGYLAVGKKKLSFKREE